MKRKPGYFMTTIFGIAVVLVAINPVFASQALAADKSPGTAQSPSPPQVQWTRTFGGDGFDSGQSVRQTLDGGYIIAGTTTSFGAGGKDIFLVKTNSAGNLTWSRTFGGQGDDFGYSVQPIPDGGYIIAGYTNSFGAGGMDIYLVKTDSSGNMTWQKTFGGGWN